METDPGQQVTLRGSASDPDGEALNYRWWQYEEVGTYKGKVALQQPDSRRTSFMVPKDAKDGVTIHLILEVTDAGTPSLIRCQRVIAKVKA